MVPRVVERRRMNNAFSLSFVLMYKILLLIVLFTVRVYAKNCYVAPPVPTAENNFPTFIKFYYKVYDEPNYLNIPLWPGGIVPYLWNVDKNDDAYLRLAFDQAISQFHEKTCLKIVPYWPTRHWSYVEVVSNSDNHARIGMAEIKTTLSISCDESFTYLRYKYLHDMGHVLGLNHEHQRFDRDQFVDVNYDNIAPGMEYTYNRKNISTYFGPYDYNSFMHYPAFAFAKTGKNVMTARDAKYQGKMGQIAGLSKCDAVRLNILYNCTEKDRDVKSCYGDTSPDVCLDTNDSCNTWINNDPKQTCDSYPGFYKMKYCMRSCNNCERKCEDSANAKLFNSFCQSDQVPCSDQVKQYVCPKTCNVCNEFM